jgi:hypothetical protein
MIVDRRPYYLAGLVIGIGIIALLWFAPKEAPEALVREDVAILAKDPWDVIQVQRVEIVGPPDAPSAAYLYGSRPDGQPVSVHFVGNSPYSAPTAIRRLQEAQVGQVAEVLMVARPMVHKEFVEQYDASASHAGIAVFLGLAPVAVDSLAGANAVARDSGS